MDPYLRIKIKNKIERYWGYQREKHCAKFSNVLKELNECTRYIRDYFEKKSDNSFYNYIFYTYEVPVIGRWMSNGTWRVINYIIDQKEYKKFKKSSDLLKQYVVNIIDRYHLKLLKI